MAVIRVLVVDDHALMRSALRALLATEEGIMVVGEAGSTDEAVREAAELRPDVVLMDLSMPGASGLEAIRRIERLGLGPRSLVLTCHEPETHVRSVLEAGGRGYVMKQGPGAELVRAIRAVAAGETYLCRAAARHLRGEPAGGEVSRPTAGSLDSLSPRELAVLRLTAAGYSAAEAGGRLGIAAKTVDTYRHRIAEKLGVHHRTELVHLALRAGLLSADG